MYVDIVALKSFYASPLGRRVQQTVASALDAYLPASNDERVMGLGYAVPYLEPFTKKSERCFAMMPARQGASIWPSTEAVATALVFEEDLPLPDGCLDRIVLIHALEQTENAAETLAELWRVLVPNGQLIVVVTNRRGFWAGAEHTPFGHGEPYSRGQLMQILTNANFSCDAITETLHFYPRKNGRIGYFSSLYEKISSRMMPFLGGALVVRAQKRLYQGVPVLQRYSRRVFMPALSPQATTQRNHYKKLSAETVSLPIPHKQNKTD